jgi:hypothetical protein
MAPCNSGAIGAGSKGSLSPLNTLQASATELGMVPFVNNISCLYPVYVRGEAYLSLGQGSSAAEFQKVIDHSGLIWPAGQEHWRTWAWQAPTLWNRGPRTVRMLMPRASARSLPTKISSPSGRTLTPIFRF